MKNLFFFVVSLLIIFCNFIYGETQYYYDALSPATILATATETSEGNDTARVVTPDGLAGSIYGEKEIGWTIYDSDDNTTIADGKKGFVVPAGRNGNVQVWELVDFTCAVYGLNGATGGATTVVLRRVRGAAAVDMVSTGVTISHDEYSATDEVINDNNKKVETGDILFPDVNAITSGHPHQGLYCTAVLARP